MSQHRRLLWKGVHAKPLSSKKRGLRAVYSFENLCMSQSWRSHLRIFKYKFLAPSNRTATGLSYSLDPLNLKLEADQSPLVLG